MPLLDPAFWTDHVRRTLGRYDEPLLRQVAAKLVRTRNQWPAEELIERCVATAANAAVIDRRLHDLAPACRRLLALLGHSRQPRWNLGNLVELLLALGVADGLGPVFPLLEAGLLFPDLGPGVPRLKRFEQWLGHASGAAPAVFTHPFIMNRALGEDLGLPECPGADRAVGGGQEADGLEWPLRLDVLWQLVVAGPFRRTQQGGFFKRDLDRLLQDPLLSAAPADSLAELPDAGLLAVALAAVEGLVRESEGELKAAELPGCWQEGLVPALESLWAALPRLEAWNALEGWRGAGATAGNPFPSAYLLALLLLGRLPRDGWARPAAVEQWILEHHPFWTDKDLRPSRRKCWLETFLLGLAYQLRLVQAARNAAGDWLVRLSPVGRWLLGLGELPARPPVYAQTLLVQPNLEIVAYRQGLTPGLIGRLGVFAAWKSLGAACTLQLQPDTVYRALESGLTFDTLVQTLERHGMRPTPPAVLASLRTWANKRDRISVYPSAALLEFGTTEELNEALARGLPAVRLSERLAVVASEAAIDFRHFRLTGTRDYGLPPERCIEVDGDGVTLTIDLARSDLLLETELQRFAEPLDQAAVNGRRQYRLTPSSLAAGRDSGLSVRALEDWFRQRSGQPLSAAARLLMTGAQAPPAELRRHLVLHVASPEVADGLQQWPGTRELIRVRLGPTALAVAEEDADELRIRLGRLGVSVEKEQE
jgi:hypothetical protein